MKHLVVAVVALGSVVAMAGTEFSVACRHSPSKFAPIAFRLNATLELDGDEGTLKDVHGVVFDNDDLNLLEVYSLDEVKGTPHKAREDKWKNHLKFTLETVNADGIQQATGDNNFLLISTKPTIKRVRLDNVPNPGWKNQATFHAGLQYYIGDYGNRTEVTCTGMNYDADSDHKKKKN